MCMCNFKAYSQVTGYTNVDVDYLMDYKRKLPYPVTLEQAIKDSVFEYKNLLNLDYLEALKNLHKTLDSNILFNANFILKVQGSINYSRIRGYDCSISNTRFLGMKLNAIGIQQTLNKSLSLLSTVPYYNGEQLNAKSDFVIYYGCAISRKKESLERTYDVLSNNPILDLSYAKENGFDCLVTRVNKKLLDDKYTQIHAQINSSTNKLKGRGPICSLGALVPGLGLTLVKKDMPTLRKSLLFGSISLGAMAIGTKLYSNHYYQNYRADLQSSSAESNYRKASLTQKIFVSSFIGYCALSCIDFSFTAVIGTKNKWKQREINRYFRAHGPILF